jgi:serine protease Do
MRETPDRGWATLALVLGAMAFGIVLASGSSWTPSSFGADQAGAISPVRFEAPAEHFAGFADLAEAVAPAVVSIRSVTYEENDPRLRRRGEGDPFFDFFFGPRRRPGDPESELPEEHRSEAGGSGFLIRGDGLIVTNHHVIDGASELLVLLDDDRREYRATVRGSDPATDLALIQIEAGRDLPHLSLGRMDGLRVGDWVMVIGNPLRLGRTVTVGVVSATGRSLGLTDRSFENFIQTDAAINFGNSGGPMINVRGEVVGVATAINWGAQSIGFGVPVSTLAAVLPALEREGKVRRGYLGVEIENIDFRSQQAFDLDSTEGALVERVVPGAPAAAAGLQHGDIVIRVDREPVVDTRSLIDYVATKPPGAKVVLEVLRNGQRVERTVTLGERPEPGGNQTQPRERDREEEPASQGKDWLRMDLRELTPELRHAHGIPAGVEGAWIREISPRSPLVDERVQRGDLITEVNGQKVSSAEELERLVAGSQRGSYLRLYVQRFDVGGIGRPVQFFAIVRVP